MREVEWEVEGATAGVGQGVRCPFFYLVGGEITVVWGGC